MIELLVNLDHSDASIGFPDTNSGWPNPDQIREECSRDSSQKFNVCKSAEEDNPINPHSGIAKRNRVTKLTGDSNNFQLL